NGTSTVDNDKPLLRCDGRFHAVVDDEQRQQPADLEDLDHVLVHAGKPDRPAFGARVPRQRDERAQTGARDIFHLLYVHDDAIVAGDDVEHLLLEQPGNRAVDAADDPQGGDVAAASFRDFHRRSRRARSNVRSNVLKTWAIPKIP